eukprot:1143908-Pelagomonas_calceolata.AAC.6
MLTHLLDPSLALFKLLPYKKTCLKFLLHWDCAAPLPTAQHAHITPLHVLLLVVAAVNRAAPPPIAQHAYTTPLGVLQRGCCVGEAAAEGKVGWGVLVH